MRVTLEPLTWDAVVTHWELAGHSIYIYIYIYIHMCFLVMRIIFLHSLLTTSEVRVSEGLCRRHRVMDTEVWGLDHESKVVCTVTGSRFFNATLHVNLAKQEVRPKITPTAFLAGPRPI